jgi:hypothetical protein
MSVRSQERSRVHAMINQAILCFTFVFLHVGDLRSQQGTHSEFLRCLSILHYFCAAFLACVIIGANSLGVHAFLRNGNYKNTVRDDQDR